MYRNITDPARKYCQFHIILGLVVMFTVYSVFARKDIHLVSYQQIQDIHVNLNKIPSIYRFFWQ